METSILILGGGIGGLACAVALRQQGFEPVVCERAPRFAEVGAGLLLSANACAVIEALGLLPALRARSVFTPRWEILDTRGRGLVSIDPQMALSTRRTDLHEVLLAALPSEGVRTDHEAVHLEMNPLTVHFRDAAPLRPKLLVAAEGSQSVSRAILQPERRLHYRGYVGWRAIIQGVPAGWAPDRVSESWGRGQRFGLAPTGDGRCYWYATTNEPLEETDPRPRQTRLLESFRGWHDPVCELIAATPEESILRHPIYDIPPSGRRQFGGQVALLGDAAAALTPNLGQGCAMALEDAWCLTDCLRRARSTAAALLEYEARRRWRLAAVWAASRAVGASIQWENRLLCGVRDAGLRFLPNRLHSAGLHALLGFQAPRLALSKGGAL